MNERKEPALYEYKSNFLSSPARISYFRTLNNNTAERVLERGRLNQIYILSYHIRRNQMKMIRLSAENAACWRGQGTNSCSGLLISIGVPMSDHFFPSLHFVPVSYSWVLQISGRPFIVHLDANLSVDLATLFGFTILTLMLISILGMQISECRLSVWYWETDKCW